MLPRRSELVQPLVVRASSIPARHSFPEHAHQWHQLVYAISGVLTVTVGESCLVISPEQAVWLPTGTPHHVGSLLGAEFRSLWIGDRVGTEVSGESKVLKVSSLLRALIIEAAEIQESPNLDGYTDRVTQLIMDQLRRSESSQMALPWPRRGSVLALCEALYANPSDQEGPETWGRILGVSARTLERRFNDEVGMSLRLWRRRLRMFKAVEMLGGGASVTEIALELGYASSSAFIYAFRQEMGRSPLAYYRSQKP